MEILSDLLKITLPAGLVLFTMYLTVKSFLEKDFEKKLFELKINNQTIILPLRLQAYERMCLYLERISPHALVLRVNEPGISSSQLQQRLINDIREEFNHNLAQQIYVSDQAWNQTRNAKEEIVSIVNKVAGRIDGNTKSIELARGIFDELVKLKEEPTAKALKSLKDEIRKFY